MVTVTAPAPVVVRSSTRLARVEVRRGGPQPLAPAAFALASPAQQAAASAGAGPRQHDEAAAIVTGARVEGRALQTPVSGSISSTRGRRLHVAGQSRRNRAHLFMASGQQESRCAAVAFHASDEEAISAWASSRAPCGRTDPQLMQGSGRSAGRCRPRIQARDRSGQRISRSRRGRGGSRSPRSTRQP